MTHGASGDERIRTDTAERNPVIDISTPAGSPTTVSVGFSTIWVDALCTTTIATSRLPKVAANSTTNARRVASSPDGPQIRANISATPTAMSSAGRAWRPGADDLPMVQTPPVQMLGTATEVSISATAALAALNPVVVSPCIRCASTALATVCTSSGVT